MVKLRPMTLIKVPSIDANFANASKLLTQMSDINEHMIDALELFKFAMSSGEDQTLSSCTMQGCCMRPGTQCAQQSI